MQQRIIRSALATDGDFFSPAVMLKTPMIRISAAILSCLVVAACTTATTVPTTWTKADGRPIDPAQLQTDKTICRSRMEEGERVTNARALTPIYLPGQESPLVKVYNGCMAEHGYAVAK
jgi:hypothetical protein